MRGYLKDGFQWLLFSTQTNTMEPPSWVILVSNNHHYKHGTEKYISKHSDGKRSSQNMNHPRRREKTQSPHHSSPWMSHGGLPWHQVAQIFFSTRCFIGGGGFPMSEHLKWNYRINLACLAPSRTTVESKCSPQETQIQVCGAHCWPERITALCSIPSRLSTGWNLH